MRFEFKAKMAKVLDSARRNRRIERLKLECFEYAQALDQLVAASRGPRAEERLAKRRKLQADLRRSVLLQDLHLKLDQLDTGSFTE